MSENEPPLRIHFSFGPHANLNLERLAQIQQEAESFFLPDPSCLNVYFYEILGERNSQTQRFGRFYKQTGSYLDASVYLGLQNRRIPITPENIEQKRREYLDPNNFRAFLSHQLAMLDQLSKTRKFQLNNESLPDRQADQINDRFNQANSLLVRSRNYAKDAKIDSAIDCFIGGARLHATNYRERNFYYVSKIDYYATLARRKRPVRLFIRIGENHDGLVEKVAKHPRISSRQPEVTYAYDFGQTIANNHPLFRVILALEANPNSEIERAELLQAIVNRDIADYLTGARIPIDQAMAGAKRVIDAATVEELEALIRSYPEIGYENALTAFIAARD